MLHALLGALIIGLSLGVFGSGGSILTVPVLMYLLDVPAAMAIASSLAIVAGISLGGSLFNVLQRNISYRHVFWFGVPGMAGTYLGAWLGTLVDVRIQLSVFVLLMLVAAVFMWRGQPAQPDVVHPPKPQQSVMKIIADGSVVGVITGFVGVGGGFLIVPALVFLGGLPMLLATGTSLLIIALKSLAGFSKYYQVFTEQALQFDWTLIGWMVAGGILGSYAGSLLGSKLPKQIMQKSFAVFLVVMGSFVLVKSVL
jgi:uncharacterized membrane protein YfcA